jgi:hypothetical protein
LLMFPSPREGLGESWHHVPMGSTTGARRAPTASLHELRPHGP